LEAKSWGEPMELPEVRDAGVADEAPTVVPSVEGPSESLLNCGIATPSPCPDLRLWKRRSASASGFDWRSLKSFSRDSRRAYR